MFLRTRWQVGRAGTYAPAAGERNQPADQADDQPHREHLAGQRNGMRWRYTHLTELQGEDDLTGAQIIAADGATVVVAVPSHAG